MRTRRSNSPRADPSSAGGGGTLRPRDVAGRSGMVARYASILGMSDEPRITFTAFVMSLATTAAVHFGDVPDPATGQKQPNLPAASQMIDILAMLKDKTRGNLDAEETELVDTLLYELRMRFVEAARQGPPTGAPTS